MQAMLDKRLLKKFQNDSERFLCKCVVILQEGPKLT